MPPKQFQPHLDALALSIEGLLTLHGGTADDRERFFEILKGITSVADFALMTNALDAATHSINSAHAALTGVTTAAQAIRPAQVGAAV